MGQVIDITGKMPHIIHNVICGNCRHEWLAVHPERVCLKQLECPHCGKSGYVDTIIHRRY